MSLHYTIVVDDNGELKTVTQAEIDALTEERYAESLTQPNAIIEAAINIVLDQRSEAEGKLQDFVQLSDGTHLTGAAARNCDLPMTATEAQQGAEAAHLHVKETAYLNSLPAERLTATMCYMPGVWRGYFRTSVINAWRRALPGVTETEAQRAANSAWYAATGARKS